MFGRKKDQDQATAHVDQYNPQHGMSYGSEDDAAWSSAPWDASRSSGLSPSVQVFAAGSPEQIQRRMAKMQEVLSKLSTDGYDLPQRPAEAEHTAHGFDRVSQLERLAALRSQGVLTDDEFASQKQQILNG